jgi:aspartate aminotransferase
MSRELMLASRVTGLKPSATVEMTERVRQARLAGKDIIGLSSGDPNLPTHPAVMEAAHRAMQDGQTHYGPSPGTPSLRHAIAGRLSAESGSEYISEQILVTPGGKFAVFAGIMSVVAAGDEVILLDPCWVSYGPCVNMAGGIPVVVPALNNLDPGRLEKAITSRTRMIIVNSPVNPTGRIVSKPELETISRLAEKNNLWILYDEVYKNLLFEPESRIAIQAIENACDRLLVVNSFSKEYGMTGWRIGYLATPRGFAKDIRKVLQHSVYCVPPFIQAAAEAAMALPAEIMAAHVAEFKRRRDFMTSKLNNIPGISCHAPAATFYLFPAVEKDDWTVATEWLDKLNIAVLPGSVFGSAGKGHIRISVTSEVHLLEEAVRRIEQHYADHRVTV